MMRSKWPGPNVGSAHFRVSLRSRHWSARYEKVETVFDLLGQKENDLTFALGWVLAQSPAFLTRLG